MDKRRCAGVLLHPTSLPGPFDNGDIGHEAYRFIEFLAAHGIKVWQMLPMGPTHEDKSPYQCLSAHAGNPELISLDWLVDRGWLDFAQVKLPKSDGDYRKISLQQSLEKFREKASQLWQQRLCEFKDKHEPWLKEYALFMALKGKYQMRPWYLWPEAVRQRKPEAIRAASEELSANIEQVVFEQFIFFTQWHEVRDYAARYGVRLFGDMPIFVARDSADVWAKRKNFQVDDVGGMQYVAGVPPDAFCSTGQKWGNPLYNWEYMLQDHFSWWRDRFSTQLELFDLVRLDHFRGLDACWEIPADDETAVNGHWVDVPGSQLLKVLHASFDSLPLIAEDLGVITDRVMALKKEFGLSGMKVLQFAFDGNNTNPHLPHQHRRGDVVYTGTHDNDTTLGWAKSAEKYNTEYFMDYSGCCSESADARLEMMLHMALASVSYLCILPMQDLLCLDSDARMNIPGTVGGNWVWRFHWKSVTKERTEKIARLIAVYQR